MLTPCRFFFNCLFHVGSGWCSPSYPDLHIVLAIFRGRSGEVKIAVIGMLVVGDHFGVRRASFSDFISSAPSALARDETDP